jgi:hypothetical protein
MGGAPLRRRIKRVSPSIDFAGMIVIIKPLPETGMTGGLTARSKSAKNLGILKLNVAIGVGC